ncbi:MAG TPA: hypothetical protein VEG33_19775, partial [Streptosporangiaceae bacterium]|nr:hypothetical protein [Streptosporangiaceae bacterium]
RTVRDRFTASRPRRRDGADARACFMLPVTPVLPQTLALSSRSCHLFIIPVLPGEFPGQLFA